MILPATLLLAALAYLFYHSKKNKLSLDQLDPIESQKEMDELYKDLEDLFI